MDNLDTGKQTLVMHLPMPLLQFPLLQSRARTRVRAR